MIITSSLSELSSILQQGGVIAYPTEAVWGLGCDPFDEKAVLRILTLKQRPVEKGLILVAGEVNHLSLWKESLSSALYNLLIAKTDKPTSWVVPDIKVAPNWVRGNHQSVAIRLIQHEPIKALCSAFGQVLVSTSANTAGQPPAMTKDDVIHYFGNQIDAIFDAPLGSTKQPSQVKDLLTNKLYRD
ncbi:L-threonylcarbamoyladenylate synthase [Marinomonas sp. 2405UD68-3]|uniref:L-threonylcarbamoyladenylate synthase n=1 Tax=Marinomonas sp. 2405UD68-3 TaxID=3391835 RepID=UPI0039C93660